MGSPATTLLEYIEEADELIDNRYSELHHDIELMKNSLGINAPSGFRVNPSGDLEELELRNLSSSSSNKTKIDYLRELKAELHSLSVENHVLENLRDKASILDSNFDPEDNPVDVLNDLTVENNGKHYDAEKVLEKYAETLYDKLLDTGFTQRQVELREDWYSELETEFPLIKGLNHAAKHSEQIRETTIQSLPIDNYQGRDTENPGRPEIEAFEPEDWHCILSFGYGDLHEWIENQDLDTKPDIQHEYSLDFLQPDTPTKYALRPDAVDDLFVYEFKQPENRKLPKDMHNSGPLTAPEESNVQQVNRYLNKMDLPVGFLIYLSEEGLQRYAIEKTEKPTPGPENIFKAKEYEIDSISQLLEK